MPVVIAFACVVLIWGTTPLAIHWSQDHLDFLFAVMARMALGLAICLVAVGVARDKVPLHGRALLAYTAGGLGVFGAMAATYWGARYIPTGWVSVLYGLSPILTGLMARLWLGESFGPERWAGAGLGTLGLATIFAHGLETGSHETALGVAAILAAAVVFSASSVAVKGLGGGISAFANTTGSLAVSMPCFYIAWSLTDGQWPESMTLKAAGAIAYLGIVASTVGFALFYYVLKHMDASRAMLIPLLAPVIAVALGATLNGEELDDRFLAGGATILLGLAVYQWGRVALVRRG